MRKCVSHHHACECREREFAAIKAERDALRARVAAAKKALDRVMCAADNRGPDNPSDSYIRGVCFDIAKSALAALDAKQVRKVTIRKGSPVRQDFAVMPHWDDETVFDAVRFMPGRCRLTAHGYGVIGGGDGSYGNGALYVEDKYIVDAAPADSGETGKEGR